MKIDLISDVHLCFGHWNVVKSSDDVDVLVMAGDIVTINNFHKHAYFFEQAAKLYKHIIYVEGNHLAYDSNILTALPTLRENLSHLPNIHILEKQSVEIGDTVFIGGTMWTDANKSDPITMLMLTQSMNDFRIISKGPVPFTVEDSIREHKECLSYFRAEIEKHKDKKVIVVSHHAPSFSCVDPKYKDQHHLNCGYASDLDQFILNRPQIKVWCFGHMHSAVDMFRGSTRLICNPRGYLNYERRSTEIDPYTPKMFEV